jgi:hypothetical protein
MRARIASRRKRTNVHGVHEYGFRTERAAESAATSDVRTDMTWRMSAEKRRPAPRRRGAPCASERAVAQAKGGADTIAQAQPADANLIINDHERAYCMTRD